jgi:alpha-L-fucosidase
MNIILQARISAVSSASLLLLLAVTLTAAEVAPPRPVGPLPNAAQLHRQRAPMAMFFHFGVNTFTNREWGLGNEDPSVFNPTDLDCGQWAKVAKDSGFTLAILTAKHHDGFCLWPSKLTDHSVASSTWRGGKGDVVKEFADACDKSGIEHGVYLSPWDRHEPSYSGAGYNDYYKKQLTELFTSYPTVQELWMDGAKGDNRQQSYDLLGFWKTAVALRPNVVVATMGAHVRWVGNESGLAKPDESSVISLPDYAKTMKDAGVRSTFEPLKQFWGTDQIWWPAECDVSIRPGWFYHAEEDGKVKTLATLLDIYFSSVGRNAVLLLNVPPDKRGLIADADVQRLHEFKAALDTIFKTDLAKNATLHASNVRGNSPQYSPDHLLEGNPDVYWATDDDQTTAELDVDLGTPQSFNLIRLEEPIQLGERIRAYHVDAEIDGAWKPLFSGSVIGSKQLERFPAVTARKLRMVIDKSLGCPLLSGMGVYSDPFGVGGK